jgi:hypothetical protein
MIAKTFRTYAMNFLRHEKSLRDNASTGRAARGQRTISTRSSHPVRAAAAPVTAMKNDCQSAGL